MKNKQATKIISILSITLLILDQSTKLLAKIYLNPGINFTQYLGLNYTENTGIAWSIQIPQQLLIPLNLIIFTSIIAYLIKNLNLKNNISKVIISLFIAGALGNIYDRITRNYVIDFINIWKWPIFNLADTYLVIGGFIIITYYGKIIRKN